MGVRGLRYNKTQPQSNSTSGVVGVAIDRAGKWRNVNARATLRMPNGKWLSARFSIERWGRREAIRLASLARKRFEKRKHQMLRRNNGGGKL